MDAHRARAPRSERGWKWDRHQKADVSISVFGRAHGRERTVGLLNPPRLPVHDNSEAEAMNLPRFLPVDGLTNIRDLGGYPAGAVARTRANAVYRSDSPHRVSATGLTALIELGVVTVIDLRSAAERSESPGPLPSLHFEIQENVAENNRFDVFGMSGRVAGETMLRDLMSTCWSVLLQSSGGSSPCSPTRRDSR